MMPLRALRSFAGTIAALALLLLAPAAFAPAFAEDAPWKTFTRPALGLSIQRPADLYELDPEAPAENVNGEVEWGPKDHAWSILITSQALADGQTLASIVADEKKRNPQTEAATAKIGDGVEAVRIWSLDEDALSLLVLLLDKTGSKLIAIELSIALTEDDAEKSVDSLRISYNGTIKLFERMLETVKIAKS
ncbi:MAG: hypothetical protein KIT16_12620 [Rhodospirillaceae bacterium]|nr:hypothetical protein [Rhodospirillaceae bacterium]